MRKFMLFIGVGVGVLIALFLGVDFMNMRYTKSFSPEETVEYKTKEVHIEVFYNRPFKKGREIFGALVPYNKVWRTGANEATLLTTNQDLTIEGKLLKAGRYSLWTIPGPNSWQIIFNTETGQWGVNAEGNPNRNPQNDVLQVYVPALTQDRVFEQFTIEFNSDGEELEMVLLWDKTLVPVPIKTKS
ncbi:MAG: DUF2911 domain-containing protein [Cyclobacteriaceae bacterium]|jgi:hypothetical protein|nr:DUF2911 domain-containing protein [Cyclobacteriaceae bacterium]